MDLLIFNGYVILVLVRIMKKSNYIINLTKSVFVTILLFYFWIKTSNGKIVLIPFILCAFSQVSKYIFLLFNKGKYVKYCNIIFVISFFLFWFGFLIYGTYVIILNKEYSILLFTIPFWIVGIIAFKKILIRGNSK